MIDLEPWWSGNPEGRRAVAARVGRACEEIGFLAIVGHRVEQELLDRAFAVSGAFFDLPDEKKRALKPDDEVVPRGYQALATRNLARTLGHQAPPDLREQFFIGPLDDWSGRFAGIPEAGPFYAANIWPRQPADYREVFVEYYTVLETLARELMRIFAVALDLSVNYFDDKIDRHFNTCPANFYPAPDDDPLPGQIRCGAHTDFGSLTILAFNDAPGGLQVMMPDGAWQDVAAQPGQLVVNLGDMMQRWTNDRWKSTLHRVINPPADRRRDSRRQSIGYFLHPNYDAEISCIETCCDEGRPARYPTIRAGDHMREKMQRRVDS